MPSSKTSGPVLAIVIADAKAAREDEHCRRLYAGDLIF